MSKGKMRKQGMDKRIRDTFISKDADSVGEFIIDDVIIPGIRSMLLKAGHGIVDSIFGNTSTGYNYGTSYSYRRRYDDEASYNTYRRRNRNRDDDHNDSRRHYSKSAKRSAQEIDVRTWQDADKIHNLVCDLFGRNEELTFFELVDILAGCDVDVPDTDYTDNEWGWNDITGFHVHYRSNGRAYIEIPRQVYLK